MHKLTKSLIVASLLFITIVLISGCVATETVSPYPFDTAKIEYNLSGSLEGTQIVYIKGDNAIHETHATTKENNQEVLVDILYLELGESLYDINLATGEGTKVKNPIYNELTNLNKEERIDYLTRLAVNVDEAAGVPIPKSESEYAGQKCKLYDIEGLGEICMWSGIPLYSKLSPAGGESENTMTAVSVEIDTSIPDNMFQIPAGVTITDLASL